MRFMGTWGVGVFSDDVAMDVRGDWREAILDGADAASATQALEVAYAAAIADEDDSVIFWLALAAAQMETGGLLDAVRDRAVAIIDAGGDVERWREESEGLANQRAKVLDRLRAKLVGPQPAPKRLRRTPQEQRLNPQDVPTFDAGDVVLARHPETGAQTLVSVVDSSEALRPIVEFLIWDEAAIPGREELALLPRLRFLHRDGTRSEFVPVITTSQLDAFRPQFGEVIAKAVPRTVPDDWRSRVLSFNWTWPMVARSGGKAHMNFQFKHARAELGIP